MAPTISIWRQGLGRTLLAVLVASVPLLAVANETIDDLLHEASRNLSIGPTASQSPLNQLSKLESSMTIQQKGIYFKLRSASYAFRGMYKEEAESGKAALSVIADPDARASLLYYVADGYANLGQYEEALQPLSDAIQILPKVTRLEAKADILQSAYSLYQSLYAYEEAATYARRLIDLAPEDAPTRERNYASCVGLADLIELSFLNNNAEQARSFMQDEARACDEGGYKNISLSVQALDYSDKLAGAQGGKYLADATKLLTDLNNNSGSSDYSIQLADAIAQRYKADGDLAKAEQYAVSATKWANAGNAILLQQKANEILGSIFKAEGKLAPSLSALETSNKLWAKLLEERSHKELAYQRIKFKVQDQSVQLSLLSQINKLLSAEKDLQEKNKQFFEMLVVAAGLLLTFVSIWLVRTWRQRNDYRTYSQTDSLTKISNRAHFIACSHKMFKDPRGNIAIILFDMDEFKLINDTYSHAAGDWVLASVSAAITACLRAEDLFGRLGGEEFALCLPHTLEHEAMTLAERCRKAIESIDTNPCGHQFFLSASFGIAIRPPNGNTGFEEVLAAADRALYRAKNLGRNRIEAYGEVVAHGSVAA